MIDPSDIYPNNIETYLLRKRIKSLKPNDPDQIIPAALLDSLQDSIILPGILCPILYMLDDARIHFSEDSGKSYIMENLMDLKNGNLTNNGMWNYKSIQYDRLTI